jgi:predicted DNA-binding protein (MmcQ/YjbR family)
MPTAKTALRRMREICLAFPETVEAEHFGEVCFRVGERIFASCGEKAGACRLVFQLEAEHASRLVASDPRFEPYMRQKHCVSMDAAGVEDWDEVRALVLESYRLNAPSDRPRKRASTRARNKRPKTNK